MHSARAPRLILASASPRRRQLLAEGGFDFEVVNPDVLETATASLSIGEITTVNATRKARAVARSFADAVVVGADTLVALDGEVIGKPTDLGDALKTLRRLSGNEHQVCTSVCIRWLAQRRSESFAVVSHVRFRHLRDPEIHAYLGKINPLDKAGAYAAQGHGAEIISGIRGSYTNVVGLPMDETVAALRRFGL